MNIDDIKKEKKTQLILILLFKYNIFKNLREEEFLTVYKKFQDFTSKYFELNLEEIITLFKKEFDVEIKERNNNIQTTEFEILREFIIQLYTKNEFLINDTLRLVNTNSRRLIQNILKEVNRNSINKFVENSKSNSIKREPIKISPSKNIIKDIELNFEDNLKIDTINFSEIFEVKIFLKNYIEDNEKLRFIYETIKPKLDSNITIKIDKIGLNNFINEKDDIDKNKVLVNIILFFEKSRKSFVECLEQGLLLECFREQVLEILENYICTIDMLENIGSKNKIIDLDFNLYNEDFLKYYFDIDLKNLDFNKIFEEFIDFLLHNENLFLRILEYFNSKENFKEVLEKYYSFENTKRRFENV